MENCNMSKFKNYIFYTSAILLLVSAVLFDFGFSFVPYLYAIAAAGIAVCYMTSPYKGTNVRMKRLHGYLVLSGILLVASSYFMFKGGKEWIICLLISAVLQLYTSLVKVKGEG